VGTVTLDVVVPLFLVLLGLLFVVASLELFFAASLLLSTSPSSVVQEVVASPSLTATSAVAASVCFAFSSSGSIMRMMQTNHNPPFRLSLFSCVDDSDDDDSDDDDDDERLYCRLPSL
jgi:hypothetical protein